MRPALPLLLWLLPTVCLAQTAIPPIACKTHTDCTSRRNPGQLLFALCERGVCVRLPTVVNCAKPNDCGFHQSCLNRRCVLGGDGAPCGINSANCMPGFSCDAASKKCVKGLAGVVCRHKDDCGFGHSCLFGKKDGVCKLGTEGTFACRRDTHCKGPLRCFSRPFTRGNLSNLQVGTEYRCGRPVDLPGKEPKTFGTCDTEAGCGAQIGSSQFACLRGKCHPLNLGQPCKLDLVAGNRHCGAYSTCQNGRCAPATAGKPCRSEAGIQFNAQCEPGTRCNAPEGVGLGRPGTCIVGELGEPCRDGRECKKGFVCGTGEKCAKSAEGQRCSSDYWCPEGMRCSKKRRTCTKGPIPPEDRFPNVRRGRACKSTTDCGEGVPCRNGVCLPRTLGWACNEFSEDGTVCVGGVVVEGTEGKVCSTNQQCFFGMTCRDGKCAPTGLGDSCWQQYQCPPHTHCSQQTCGLPGRGAECSSSEQCVGKLKCLPYRVFGLPFGLCAEV